MAHRITGIDHVLLAVRDLDGARDVFHRLGFAATPRGAHAEWGTANHCLMFSKSYIELIQPVGEGPGARQISAVLDARGDGLAAVALGTSDAAQSHQSLLRAGVAAAAPAPLSRRLQRPEGEAVAQFSVVDLAAGSTPGLRSFICQHLTPDLLRCPEWVAHPNGAVGIYSLTVMLDRPEAAMGDYNRIFGPAASTPTDEMVTVHTGGGLLYLVTPDGFHHLHPELDMDPPAPPAPAVLTVRVADLDKTADWLRQNGVAALRKGPHLGVDPTDCMGIGLEFTE